MLLRRLLILCTGNLCRSPLAEALLRSRLSRERRAIEVASAGIIAVSGKPADEDICLVAARHGLDLSGHRSRPLDSELLRWADLVLVMEEEQRRYLTRWAPECVGKVRLLGHWDGVEIPDPFREGAEAALAAYEKIEAAVDAWLVRL